MVNVPTAWSFFFFVLNKPTERVGIQSSNLLEVCEFSGGQIEARERGLPLGDDPARLPPTDDPGNLAVADGEVGRTVVEPQLRAILHHLPALTQAKHRPVRVRAGATRAQGQGQRGSESIGRAPPLRHAAAGAAAGVEERHGHSPRGEERRAHGAGYCDRRE